MNWNTTKTGRIYHSFNNGQAMCTSRIKDTNYVDNGFSTTREATEACKLNRLDMCRTCVDIEAAAAARLGSSLAPSTGEGDHLPPADICGVTMKNPATGREGNCIKPKGHGSILYSEWEERLHEMNPAACCEHESMYHGARGCDRCACTTPRVKSRAPRVIVESPTLAGFTLEELQAELVRREAERVAEQRLAEQRNYLNELRSYPR